MRDSAIRQRSADCQINHVLYMGWPHDALVVGRYVRIELVEGYILLRVCADQVMKLKAGERQHRCAVHLGVVQSVQQMNASGPRGRQTHTQPPGKFCVAARHECRRLFVAYLDEANLVLPDS